MTAEKNPSFTSRARARKTSKSEEKLKARVRRGHRILRRPKDVVLLQLAMLLIAGEDLSHERLRSEFLLQRRSAERYIQHLKDAGLPIVVERESRVATYFLDPKRARFDLEAIDVPLHAARSLSL